MHRIATPFAVVVAAFFVATPSVADRAFHPSARSFQTHPIVPERELLITDPAVVDSHEARYPGPFSFGYLFEEMAGERDVAEFLLGWLGTWERDQMVNHHRVAARPLIRDLVIRPWQKKDGFTGAEGEKWNVNFDNAPFRLLAIVPRSDLGPTVSIADDRVTFGNAVRYYGSSESGELRFVYGVNDPDGEPLDGGFTVIFEYAMPDIRKLKEGKYDPDVAVARIRMTTEEGRIELAKYSARWHRLGAFDSIDDGYRALLAELTGEVTSRTAAKDKAGRARPLLAQIRTNEGALGVPQELREFDYDEYGTIVPDCVAGTPAPHFNHPRTTENRELARFLNDFARRDARRSDGNGPPVLVSVPKKIELTGRRGERVSFLGGHAQIPADAEGRPFHWNARHVRDRELRRSFSLNTCSGCHAGETQTQFYHIKPRRSGEASELSKFLRLDDSRFKIVDPASSRKIESREMHERTVIFEALLNPHYRASKVRRLLHRRSRRGH